MITRLLRPLVLVSALALLGTAYARFRGEKVQQLAHLRTGSKIAALPSGAVEYAEEGEGPPLVVIHGGGGGFEQGLLIGRTLSPHGEYRLIAPSRPGARRTPLSSGPTLSEQARLLCELLDHLGVERAVIAGMSAGGMLSVQFAADHPERCRALVLLSAITPVSRTVHGSFLWLWLMQGLMASDFLLWMLVGAAKGSLLRIQGNRVADFAPDNAMMRILDNTFPSSDWRANVINDLRQLFTQDASVLEAVRVPALLVYGTADTIVPHEVAVHTVGRIPGASHVSLEGGTHMALGTHGEAMREVFEAFIRERG